MAKSNQLGAVILGAAAALALYKFYSMPKEKRERFFLDIRDRTEALLEDAETTVEKLEHYVAQIKNTGENDWIDKLFHLKRMLSDLYGQGQRSLSTVTPYGVNMHQGAGSLS